MTDEALARLPSVIRDVVETDRKIVALMREPVPDLDAIRKLRVLRADQRRRADHLYGYTAKGTAQ